MKAFALVFVFGGKAPFGSDRRTAMRAKIGLVLMIVSVATVDGNPPSSEPPASASEAEIGRLTKALSEALRENGNLKKRIKEQSATIDRLDGEVWDLRRAAKPDALAYLREGAAAQLADLLEAVDKSFRGHFGLSSAETDGLWTGFLAGVLVWKGRDAERAKFTKDAEAWLASRAERQARREAEGNPYSVDLTSGQGIAKALKNKTGGEAAKIIGTLLGRRVIWGGIVTRVVDSPILGYDLELDCSGCPVYVALAVGSVRDKERLTIGSSVSLSGIIAHIESFGFAVSVTVNDGRISGFARGG